VNNSSLISRRALRFLDTHDLDHSPEHYAFAYRYVLGTDRAFSDAVDHEIEGGIRLRTEAVRALMPMQDAPTAGPAFGDLSTQLLELLKTAASATSDLNRDLVRTAAALVSAEPPRMRKLVIFMIERTAEAEMSLSAALLRAQALRDSLNGARDDIGRDALTGLPGRDSMASRLAASVADSGHCAIGIIDIDQLPELIAEHGSLMGDRVLKAAALTLQDACSPYQVGRWDGMSFMALVDDPSMVAGIEKLETACANMASRRLKLRENDEPLGSITFSAGVATTRSRTVAEVTRAAAKLMRKARKQGGNRVAAESRLVEVSTVGQP